MENLGSWSAERLLLVSVGTEIAKRGANCYVSVGALIAAGITLGTGKWNSTWAWRLPSLIQGIFSLGCIIVLPFM